MNKIISPPERVIYEKNNWYVYFDPSNVVWVKVNEDGKKVLTEFEFHADYAEALAQIKQKYQADDATVEQFITYMVDKAKYLHRDEYHPRSITFPQKSAFPTELYIHLTYRCNKICVYCYNSEERLHYTDNDSYTELTIAEYHRLFTEAKDLGVKNLVYSGGEPLLRDDQFEIASISKEMGFHTSIITNGTLITKEKAALMIRYFDRISVSIDSAIEAENHKMRGNGSHQSTLQGIKFLRELNAAVSCLGVTLPEHIDHVLPSWDYFVKQLGCISFSAQAYIPDDVLHQDSPWLVEWVKKYGAMRNHLNCMNGIQSTAKLSNGCGMCSGEIAIGANGDVLPCQSLLQPEFCAGNIKQNSLKNIVETSPIFKKLRACTVDQLEDCQNCEIKYLCGGVCRATHLRTTGDFFKNNPHYCAISKAIIINGMFDASTIPNVRQEPKGENIQC